MEIMGKNGESLIMKGEILNGIYPQVINCG